MKEKNDDNSGAALAHVLLLGPCLAWYGYVLSTMWNWFVFGFLSDLRLGVLHAIGLTLTARYCLGVPGKADGDSAEQLTQMLARAIAGAILLGAGWMIHHFAFL